MALSDQHRRRRLIAAREFRGLTQKQFADAMHAYGLGKTDGPRIERGAIEWRQVHTRAFAEVLRVPVTWFTDPDDDRVVGYRSDEAASLDAAQAVGDAADVSGPQPGGTAQPQVPTRKTQRG